MQTTETGTRRNYAKAVRGTEIVELVFFDDAADKAIPTLDVLREVARKTPGTVTLSMYKRSGDAKLERYRDAHRIGIVGESPSQTFGDGLAALDRIRNADLG